MNYLISYEARTGVTEYVIWAKHHDQAWDTATVLARMLWDSAEDIDFSVNEIDPEEA